jgi:hypothetical protein
VRYQAALRPDMTSRIDSKVLSNSVTIANHDFFLNRVKTLPLSRSLRGYRVRMSTVVAQFVIGALFVHAELGAKTSWITFLAGTGAIVLT